MVEFRVECPHCQSNIVVKLQSETYLEGVPNFQEQLLRRAKTETEKRLESYSDDELETRIESMQREQRPY
jgi:DNA-directed RNA polymerase subunit RPC12/RpoP